MTSLGSTESIILGVFLCTSNDLWKVASLWLFIYLDLRWCGQHGVDVRVNNSLYAPMAIVREKLKHRSGKNNDYIILENKLLSGKILV
jgi:hypothetical protein